MLNAIRRLFTRLQLSSGQPGSTLDPQTFDPAWHGDHWQNLLSSPMDARHYVMEDWTFAPVPAFADEPAR